MTSGQTSLAVFALRLCLIGGGTISLGLTTANAALTISTTSLPSGAVGIAYNQPLVATGGTGTLSWPVTGASLPSGLTHTNSGGTTGRPTAPGTSRFTVQVRDSANGRDTQSLSIVVAPQLVVTTTSLSNGTVATAYS